MEVVPIRIPRSNYSYLLIDTANHVGAIVDVGEEDSACGVMYARAKEMQVQITTILTTHNHGDHCAGNEALVAKIEKEEGRRIEVVGGKDDSVPGVTKEVGDQDIVQVGDLAVRVLYVPCHTPGHVFFLCKDALFTGDTLSIGSCGPLFRGSPVQMNHAINEVVGTLPPETKIYCGHEFTYPNLLFAEHVEPENEAVKTKLAWAKQQLETKQYTVPSTVADELATNPFMRLREPTVQAFLKQPGADPATLLSSLRAAKAEFCGTLTASDLILPSALHYS